MGRERIKDREAVFDHRRKGTFVDKSAVEAVVSLLNDLVIFSDFHIGIGMQNLSGVYIAKKTRMRVQERKEKRGNLARCSCLGLPRIARRT